MRIVLVNPWSYPATTAHFGLLCLAAYLREHMQGLEIRIIESQQPLQEILDLKPDLVGITSNTESFSNAINTASALKAKVNIPVIIGGVHISALPKTLPDCFDIGVLNEGEETALELLELLRKCGGFPAEELRNIRGIIFHATSGIVVTPARAQIEDIDRLPPAARDLVRMDDYFKRQINLFGVKRLVSVMTSRGCVYRCVFCGSPVQWKGVRFHSAHYVAQEIKGIVNNYSADGIMFWDDLFITPLKRLKELADLLKKDGLTKKITFWGYVRANLITPEVCQILKEMNVRRVIFGLESASERILNYLKKDSVSVADNQRALELCRRYGITTSSGYIIGTPTETSADLRRSYDFMKKYPLDNTQVYTLIPYPGTEIWQIAKDMGIVKDSGMDWARLKVQLDELSFFDIFRSSKDILRDKICLSRHCREPEYMQTAFKMQKRAYISNRLFYLKTLLTDMRFLKTIFAKKFLRF
jgi:radical SAM superfamily enzyme YgiQ (UPF0313 family)